MTAMSGSYDRPSAGRPVPPAAYDPYEEPYEATGAPPPAATLRPQREAGPQPMMQGEPVSTWDVDTQRTPQPRAEPLYAEVRGEAVEKKHKHAAIVPAGSVTGRSLTLVISIMCFLACLTAGAVYMINKS